MTMSLMEVIVETLWVHKVPAMEIALEGKDSTDVKSLVPLKEPELRALLRILAFYSSHVLRDSKQDVEYSLN